MRYFLASLLSESRGATMDFKRLSGRINWYFWRDFLCPQLIHPTAVLLRSSASDVVDHYPRTRYIAAAVDWSTLRLNQIMLLQSRLLECHGEALHLAQLSQEGNLGDNLQPSLPQIMH